MVIELDKSNIEEHIQRPGIAVVNWYGGEDESARFAGVLERAASQNPEIRFGRLERSRDLDLAAQWGVNAVPVLMVFRDGTFLYSQEGELSESDLDAVLLAAWSVALDEIRGRVDGVDTRQRWTWPAGVNLPGAGERPEPGPQRGRAPRRSSNGSS